MKKLIIALVILLSAILLSGCVENQNIQKTTYQPTKYSATISNVLEITDTSGQDFSNLQIGWYDPFTKQPVNRFTDTELGVAYRGLSIYYVYDAPTELTLISSNPNFIYTTETKTPINNYARAPTSKGIHRVWRVDILYDTPSKDELPVGATWGENSIRTMGIGIFSGDNVASFEIKIQEPSNLGFKQGFS